MTNGGVEYSFEALGLKKTAEQAFAMLRPGGTATIVGMVPFGQKIELHGFDFLRERKIQGSSMGSNHFRTDMPRLLTIVAAGPVEARPPDQRHAEARRDQRRLRGLKGGHVVRQLIAF